MMREIIAEFRKEERQERQEPPPQLRPFDLDAETLRKQPMEDDQETLVVEPITRRKLDVPKEVEKSDWAKDLIKTMTQMQI